MNMHFAMGLDLPKTALVAALLGLSWTPFASAQTPAAPAAVQQQTAKPSVVQPAIDGILAAFKTRPLVGMSDAHGLAQQQDFYAALIRYPRFAREVGNVVVEFGTASHQAIIDRYVAGEDVPYAELRKVWSDAVGWNPTVTYIGFANFFANVRAVNLTLPPAQRIRVWLGDPPVDWTATEREIRAVMETRDSYPADLIVENLLSKNRKALVIYGGAHLSSSAPLGMPPKLRSAPSRGAEAALRKLIADVSKGTPDYEAMTPQFAEVVRQGLSSVQADLVRRGAITGVAFASGDDSGRDSFVVTFANTGPEAMALERDTQGRVSFLRTDNPNLREAVERRYPGSFFIVWPHRGHAQLGCSESFESNLRNWPVPALATSVRGSSLESELRKGDCSSVSPTQGIWFDGYLYLGPVATLVRSPALPDLYLDPAYRAEIARRQPLKGAQPLPLTVDMQTYSATPRPWHTPAAAPARDQARTPNQ